MLVRILLAAAHLFVGSACKWQLASVAACNTSARPVGMNASPLQCALVEGAAFSLLGLGSAHNPHSHPPTHPHPNCRHANPVSYLTGASCDRALQGVPVPLNGTMPTSMQQQLLQAYPPATQTLLQDGSGIPQVSGIMRDGWQWPQVGQLLPRRTKRTHAGQNKHT